MKYTIRHYFSKPQTFLRAFCVFCVIFLSTSCVNDVSIEWSKVLIFRTPHYLNVSLSYVHFSDGAGGVNSIVINSTNTSWAVTDLPEWLTVDTQKGSETTTVTLRCAANPSPKNARAALFYVRSTDDNWDFSLPVSVSQVRCLSYALPQTETVIFDGKENRTSVAITTNVEDWTVTSATEWLTVEKGSDAASVHLAVTPNPFSSDRQGTVVVKSNDDEHYIRVTQHPAGISSTLDRLDYIVDAGEQTVVITADAPWTAESSYAWISVQPSAGPAGTTEVTARTTANNSMAERTGNIYFKMSDENMIQLPVHQDGITFALSDESLTFDCKGEKKTFLISSNAEWELASDLPDWVTLSVSEGKGDAELTVIARTSVSITPRSATLTFKPKAVDSFFSIVITQNGHEISMETNPLQFTNKRTSQSFSFEATGNWTVTSDAWITVSPASGTGDATCLVTVDENTGDEREGKITLTFYEDKHVIPVTQQGAWLTLSTEGLQFTSTGGTLQVDLASNTRWTSTTGAYASWLTVNPESGEDNSTLTIGAADNPSTDNREGQVAVTPQDQTPLHVSIAQAARYMNVNSGDIDFFAVGGTSGLITVDTDGAFAVTTEAAWLTITTVGEKSFTLTAADNTTTEIRKATVTVALTDLTSGELSRTIAVSQDVHRLEISADSATFAAPGGVSSIVTIDTDGQFEIVPGADWLSINMVNEKSFTITATDNTTADVRETIVTVRLTGLTSGEIARTISVSQAVHTLDIDTKNVNFAAPGGTSDVVVVSTDGRFVVTSTETWLTVNTVNDSTFTLTAADNNLASERTARVNVALTGLTSGEIARTISVSQAVHHLEISTDNVEFAAAGGVSSVVMVDTDGEFEVVPSADWLSINTVNEKSFTISASKNPTTEERSATVTVRLTGLTSGEIARTISVSQAVHRLEISADNVEFAAAGGVSSVVMVDTDGEFEVVPSADWLSINMANEKSFTITAPKNPTSKERTATVTVRLTGLTSGEIARTIAVSQDVHRLEISADSATFAAPGGVSSVVTIDTDGQFEIVPGADWLSINTVNEKSFTITATDNSTADVREATVTVRLTGFTSGEIARTISVSQAVHTLDIDTENVNFAAPGGTSDVVVVRTDGRFVVTSTETWLTVNTVNDSTFTLTAAENNLASERTATVNVALTCLTSGEIARTISVSQAVHTLDIDTENVSFAAPGGTSDALVVRTDGRFAVTTKDAWLTVNEVNDSTFTLTAADNNLTHERTATVNVALMGLTSGEIARTISVSQAVHRLVISADNVEFAADGGVSSVVMVDTDGEFEVVPSADWLSINMVNEKSFTITAPKNPTSKERTATVTVRLIGLTEGEISRAITIVQEEGNGYVDLGLSVMWATCNVGANSPEDYGDYFAWGETEPKSDYSWETLKYRISGNDLDNVKFSKYNTSSDYGTVDNKTVLELSDDVAYVNLGGSWRMPTIDEIDELINNCTLTWTTQGGHDGYKVTSKSNGNSIFLPAAGSRDGTSLYGAGSIGYYWSSSLDTSSPVNAWSKYDISGYGTIYRKYGQSVRPVCEVETSSKTFSLSVNELTFTSVGGTEFLLVTSNQSWTVSSDVDWLTLPRTSGSGNATWYVTAGANTSTESRSGSVTFSAGGKAYTVSVTQAGAELFFNVTPTALSFTSSAGSKSVSVTSNQSWTASSNVNWLTLSQISGTGDATLSVTAEANTFIESRLGIITFSAGGKDYTVNVVQNGDPYSGSHAYVDLGLSVMWATCNVGASSPEDYGSFFAWGETTTKFNYDLMTYKWSLGYDLTILDLEEDAAHVNWGGGWRMPTKDEFEELCNNCNWTWTTQGSYYGCEVTSKLNGKSIFLPAAGGEGISAEVSFFGSEGFYWSSSLDTSNPSCAWYLDFYSGGHSMSSYNGGYGLSVRPVFETLSLSVKELTFNSVGGTKSLLVTSNQSWTASSDVNWLTLSQVSGMGDATLSVTAEANTSTESRSGTVTFNAGGKAYTVSVTQAGAAPTFNVTPTALSFTSSAGSKSVSVTSNQSWTASSDVNWLMLSQVSGTGDATLSVTAGANTFIESRLGIITFSAGGKDYMVNVVQNGNPDSDSHEYVDLGLSVKWATCNVGASSLEDYGDYFAWGETEPKGNYDWSTYKWYNGSITSLTKYNNSSSQGTIDNKTVLELSDDAAHINWGSSWRMPTKNEFDELLDNCTWTWTTQGGHNGYKVKSKSNGNSIFLPAAGCRYETSLDYAGSNGYYWSSSLSTSDPYYAWYLDSFSGTHGMDYIYCSRGYGLSVRPVCP